ncbi:hypothetical protein SASPL_134379 [Salvia splendens]|uniref:Uncharacterized protein n=1 Tax=Salvia splendens TaxID=180675 RepID=A0A8X8ZK01_SALSN|nr:hypothetical protein SASPL_134379 [Salvia splendens]
MWVLYVLSLPLTVLMVGWSLWYFVGPDVPLYVRFTVGYTWSKILLLILLHLLRHLAIKEASLSCGAGYTGVRFYLHAISLSRAVAPVIQGYEDAGDFTIRDRLRTSVHVNLIYYLSVGSIALCGLVLLVVMHKDWGDNILGLAMACANTFGLVTGAFLLGYGLSEIPRGAWTNANWTYHHKFLSHNVYRVAVKLDDAHQEFSNAIVVAQATSKQMSKRDPLKPYMNKIDKMLAKMLNEDSTFKPQGGKLGEGDMDYDTDKTSMASLRKHLRKARERYYRYKSEYTNFVREALELEDTMKSYEYCSSNGWKYMSSFRPVRKGKFGSFLDISELMWRCIVRKQLGRIMAVILGCMTAAILVAEATIMSNDVDLSLFSVLINKIGRHELLVQLAHDMRVRNWNIFNYQDKAVEDADGFNPAGLVILNKERSWVEQGHKVGELIVPLARNFHNVTVDLESGGNNVIPQIRRQTSRLIEEEGLSSHAQHLRSVMQKDGDRGKPHAKEKESDEAAKRISMQQGKRSTSGVASTWESMKTGFQNFKSLVDANRFIQLGHDTDHRRTSSPESLDEIFERISRPSSRQTSFDDEIDLGGDIAMAAIQRQGLRR